MGYFSGLFPELDEPELEQQQVLGGPGSDTRRKNDAARDKSEKGLIDQQPKEEGTPDTRKEVVKAQVDYTNATSDAIKALDETIAQQKGKEDSQRWGSLGHGNTLNLLTRAREQAVSRNADVAKLADDLQQLGATTGSAKLLDAAKKLANAHKGQQMIAEMRKPSGPLGVPASQVGQQSAALGSSIQKKEQELQTAGEIRTPKLQQEIEKLKQEKTAAEVRANQYRMLKDASGAPQGMAAPSVESGTIEFKDDQPKYDTPNPNHINSVFEDLGIYTLNRQLGVYAAGLALSWGQLNTRITNPGPALLRVLAAVDKKGVYAQYMNAEALAAQRYDREARATEDAKMSKSERMEVEEEQRLRFEREASQNRIAGKEQQLRQLYARLKETPIMRTWYGMIAYVLLSILTRSPSFAARTLMGSQHPEVLGNELRRIQRSIDRENQWGQHLAQQYSVSRRQAIQNQQGREERLEQRSYMERKEQSQMQAYAERARARAEEADRKEKAKEQVTALEKRNASIDKKLTAAYDRAVYEREAQRRIARAEKVAFNGDKVKMKAAEDAAAMWDAKAIEIGEDLKAWDAQFLPVFEREK